MIYLVAVGSFEVEDKPKVFALFVQIMFVRNNLIESLLKRYWLRRFASNMVEPILKNFMILPFSKQDFNVLVELFNLLIASFMLLLLIHS
jgi:hypothetical protein